LVLLPFVRSTAPVRLASALEIAIHGEIVRHADDLGEVAGRDHALRTDENLLNVARYIIANPLRAGLVTRIGDYPLWDSIWL